MRSLFYGLICGLMLANAASARHTVTESGTEIVIETPAYRAAVSREGLAMKLFRRGELVLDLPAVSPFPAGARQRAKLRSYKDAGGVVALEYNGARTEIRPLERSIGVTTWFHYPGAGVVPALAWRMEPGGYWYGGAFQGLSDEHVSPLNRAHFDADSFVAKGSTQGTPLWYSTKGAGVWLHTHHDFRYSANRKVDGVDDGLLRVELPGISSIRYTLLIEEDGRKVVRRILDEIGYPHAIPPAGYLRMPVYTTWVEMKGNITQEKIVAFARKIHDSNLPCGTIEIDIGWETKFGDFEFKQDKFPDPKAMVDDIHKLGMKVTLWVANFVNTDSETFVEYRDTDMLARDVSGQVGITGWWAGVAAVWDFTNPRAAAEYRRRLYRLQRLYGIDGFKFDAGEANLVPRDLRTYIPITPSDYADYYNREAVAYFPYNEVRVGVLSQPTGVVQRLQDKQSRWDNRNGLAAMIPEMFHVSLRGFFHVMPDIVGGNEYAKDPIDKELLVRWAQASALAPMIQFSKGPWHYDQETIRLVREASDLHVRFSPYIYRLAEKGRTEGEPILAPLWYHAPSDTQTYQIIDQFMLGSDVVVAPVLIQGAVTRDIYLPAGDWTDYSTGKRISGGQWLRSYPAPIERLPVFVRTGFKL